MKFDWSKLESILARILRVTTEVAAIAEPIVVVFNPGIAAIYNLSVNAALQAENAAEEAASKETTHTAKLAAVCEAVTPYLAQAAEQARVSAPTQATITAYAQSVLAGLEALSANHAS